MARAKDILFRIFYSTSYTFVFFVTLAFICASPADTLYQSYRRRRLIDIAFISGAYVLTGLFATLIYASRIYTNRSNINAIPKTYMPIDEDELPRKRIWHYISSILLKSAVVAYQAKPRSNHIEQEIPEARERILAALHPKESKGPEVTHFEPRWGSIEHRGWSSPAKSELPNLEYGTVVAELTDLLEAKAVGLAPNEPVSSVSADGDLTTDNMIIEALTRPDNAGMRQYITQLTDLGVMPDTSLAVSFLAQYERARFAPRPLSEDEFQTLMRLFADLLRSMKSIDPTIAEMDDLQLAAQTNGIATTSDAVSGNANNGTKPHTSFSAAESNNGVDVPPSRISEDSVPSQATDESRQRDANPDSLRSVLPRRSRADTRHSTRTNTSSATARRMTSAQRQPLHRQRSQASELSTRSSGSRKSGRSGMSTVSDTGSVIVRLNNDDNIGSPPFTIEMPSNNSHR